MNDKFTFVTGFFGSDITGTAMALAAERGAAFVSLDDEIERADGRSVLRICMVMGEHEYRNKEYECLSAMVGGAAPRRSPQSAVVACGDGVLLDEMSRELIMRHELIITGMDMTEEDLWQNAKNQAASCHAFMYGKDEDAKRTAFGELYKRQQILFAGIEK